MTRALKSQPFGGGPVIAAVHWSVDDPQTAIVDLPLECCDRGKKRPSCR